MNHHDLVITRFDYTKVSFCTLCSLIDPTFAKYLCLVGKRKTFIMVQRASVQQAGVSGGEAQFDVTRALVLVLSYSRYANLADTLPDSVYIPQGWTLTKLRSGEPNDYLV